MAKELKMNIAMICLLVLCITVGITNSYAANQKAVSMLLENSDYWVEKGNFVRAKKPLDKLLLADPDNAAALYRMWVIENHLGHDDKSDAYLKKIQKINPNSAKIKKLRRTIYKQKVNNQASIKQARDAAKQGKIEEAVSFYKKAFTNIDADDALLLEYYQTAARSNKYWDLAAQGFKRLAAKNPHNDYYAFELAKHLTYRNASRTRGIRQLETLAHKKASRPVMSAWKKSLTWLPVEAESIPFYQDYLFQDKYDKDIRKRLLQAKLPAKENPDNLLKREAFLALDYEALDRAESYFKRYLQKHPRDSDANGGLGIVQLKKKNHVDSVMYLKRAIAFDKKSAHKWGSALQTAQYWQHVEMARSEVKSNHLKKAEQRLREAIQFLPNEIEARYLLAKLKVKKGDRITAMKLLNSILVKHPGHYPSRLEQTRLRMSLNPRNATLIALNLLESYPQQTGVAQLFVDAYSKEKKSEQRLYQKRGIAALEKNLISQPDDVWIRFALAKMYRQTGNSFKARSLLDGLIRTHPKMVEVRYIRAQMAADKGLWDDAFALMNVIPTSEMSDGMKSLLQKIELNQKIHAAYDRFQQGNQHGAVALLTAADTTSMQADKDFGQLIALVDAWLKIGEAERALLLARRIMHAAPANDYNAKLTYLSSLIANDEVAEAELWLKQLQGQRMMMDKTQLKTFDAFRRGLAIKYSDQARLQKNYSTAWDYLEPFLHNTKTDDDVNLALARIYHDAGRDKEAASIYQKLLISKPENLDVLEAATYSEIALKNFSQASDYINRGLRLLPQNERFYLLKAQLEQVRDNKNEALKALQRVKEIRRGPIEKKRMPSFSTPMDNQRLHNPFLNSTRYGGDIISSTSFQVGPPAVIPYAVAATPVGVPALGNSQHNQQVLIYPVNAANTSSVLTSANTYQQVGGVHQYRTVTGENLSASVNSGRTFRDQAALHPVTSGVGEQDVVSLEGEIARLSLALSSSLSSALDMRSVSGEAGFSQISDYEVPVRVRFWPGGKKLQLKMTPVALLAGRVNTTDVNVLKRFGSLAVNAPVIGKFNQYDTGVAFQAGFDTKSFGLDIGISPVGFTVMNVVGGISIHPLQGPLKLNVSLDRRTTKESILSYAGTIDPGTGVKWGGVVKNRLSASFSFEAEHKSVFYGASELMNLTGQNVQSNNAISIGVGGYAPIFQDDQSMLRLGGHFSILGYQRNLSFYTLGHGGYFSPQNYFSMAIPLRYEAVDGALSYQLSGYLGWEKFHTKSVNYYPIHSALQQKSGGLTYPGTNVSTINGGLKGAIEYMLTPKLSIGLNLAFDNSKNYSELRFNSYFHYYFDGLAEALKFHIEPLQGYFSETL
ncbi:MAG: cellulose synthase subunit BcsC-related outer membrane protein [Mariprofundus sp.]